MITKTHDLIQIEKQLRLARAYAASKVPFFAEALFAAKLVITPKLPAFAAIDAFMRVYFNPMNVDELLSSEPDQQAVEQLAWIWVHEISHAMRDHRTRAAKLEANAQVFNLAADIEINDNNFAGLKPPTCYPPVTHRTFEFEPDHLAEYYYEKLRKKVSKRLRMKYVVDEGSGVHGEVRPWEIAASSGYPAVSSTQQAGLRLAIADAMLDASDYQGCIPAGWLRWAESTRPKIDWRQALRRRVQRSVAESSQGRGDYSYRVPNRRANAYAPFLRPSLRTLRKTNLTVVVDTSGSMDQRLLSRCMSEMRGILEATQCEITAIACDAQAYEPVKILTKSDVVVASQNLRGGGGTDLIVGIEAAMVMQPKPDIIVVLTDGFTPYPNKPYTDVDVIFGIIQCESGYYSPRPDTPPWKVRDIVDIPLN